MALACAGVAGALLGVTASAAQATDDYPWAWQGQCPILPQVPIDEPEPAPVPAPGDGQPTPPRPMRNERLPDVGWLEMSQRGKQQACRTRSSSASSTRE